MTDSSFWCHLTIWNWQTAWWWCSKCRKMTKTQDSHSWCNPLPCFAMGAPHKLNLDISRHNGGYTGLRSLVQKTRTNILTPRTRCPPSCMCNHWKRSTQLWSTRNWHPFSLISSSNGDVPCQCPCLYHHAHQQMVKQRCPSLNQKTSRTNFPITLQSRCSHYDLSEWSQTLHLVWYPTTTPDIITITTMPRRDTILDATRPSGCSYQRSLFSTDWSTMQNQ